MPRKTSTSSVSEYYEILHANYIFQDDSNGEIRFVIRDLENKLPIFNRNLQFCNRNYDFALIPEIGISRILQKECELVSVPVRGMTIGYVYYL